MTTITIEYIAGLFDGEGSISYIKGKRASGNICYTPCINIAQQQDAVLYMVKDFFGFGQVNGPYRQNNCSDFHTRAIIDVVVFLEALIPHLIVKKQRAIDLVKLCKMRVAELEKCNAPYSEEFVSAVNDFRGDDL